jgi:hypothetical protein
VWKKRARQKNAAGPKSTVEKKLRRSGKTQRGGDLTHCRNAKADVIIESNAQLFGTPIDVIPAHAARESFILEFLLD